MTVTLAPNQYPAGTLAGSPVKVIDTYTNAGQTSNTTSFPISDKAQVNDFILVFFGYGATGGNNLFVTAFNQSPTPFSGGYGFEAASGSQTNAILGYYHVVRAGEAGTIINTRFPAPVFVAWGIVVYCLRYADAANPIDGGVPGITGNRSIGDALNAATTSCGTTTPNTLIVSALSASSGAAGVGIAHGPLAAWHDVVDAVGGSQPNYGLVSGIIDMPYAAVWQGAACQWNAGAGSINSDFTAINVPVKAMPAPGAPLFYVNPAGGSVDAMGTAGRPLTAHWVYTPVSGQGAQLSWLFARQPTAGGAAQFWNGDTNGWVSSEYWNYGSISSYTFPASAWADDGTQWDTYMAITESALFLKSALAGPVTFTTQAPPAVTAVTVTNPGTTTPTINWTEALTNSPQIAYRVRVFSADQLALPGFDPHNILVDDESDFELTIGAWSGTNTTLSLGATHNYTGGGDLKIQATGTSGFFAVSGAYPVTPGVAYRASAYAWADTTPRAVTLGIAWQDANGVTLLQTNGTPVTDSTTAWNQVTVAGTAPTGAATARVTIQATASAVNEVHRLDQVHFAATPAPKWASGVVLSTATSATTAALAPSVQYTAYVEVLQTNDQWSPPLPFTNGAYVNANTATWFAGLTAAPVPTPAALTAQVGGV
jgi:hypothetical protein